MHLVLLLEISHFPSTKYDDAAILWLKVVSVPIQSIQWQCNMLLKIWFLLCPVDFGLEFSQSEVSLF